MPSADRPSNTVCSYASVHDDLAAKAKSYSQKYQQFVLEYAIEWEKVIRTRIDAGIKKAEELRIELDHYQKKTEALRLQANQAMAKGKPVSSNTQEKLSRNEEKLIASKQGYNRVATDLCILMEEVTERSWRDLHPLLIKCAQFDMTLASDEAKVLAELNGVVASLKQVATEKGLSAQPRLKDLAGLKPELLSTRPGGIAGLAIEAAPSGMSASSPLGSPLSMGGGAGGGAFPIQVSPASFGGAPVSSGSSVHSAPMAPTPTAYTFDTPTPPNMNALAITNTSSAPAPTMDDVYGATATTSYDPMTTRSAPSTGNYLPPLPPTTAGAPPAPGPNGGWNVRSSSFNDAGSVCSGFSAAPVAAPPPPPMAPPPLPPVGGMYGQPPMQQPPSYGAPPPMYQQQPPPTNPNHNPFG